GPLAGAPEILRGIGPQLALERVGAEDRVVRLERGIERANGVRSLPVQELASWKQQLAIDDFANALVRELEALARGAKDAAPDQLFHGRGRACIVELRRPPQQREVG